ncbi:MAG: DUF4872 domain-containing protein [Promethearchaeota archaeon]|nr:MAG: DUF4872 domain-containing protein [Candidatus Lokiarchaeota archaeon]
MSEKHIVEGFIHRLGKHCESSSLRDMFEFYGFSMSEPMIFGLDGTMGFAFFDYSDRFTGGDLADLPMFVGGKQDSINPKSLACRLLGIQLRKQSFTSPDNAWDKSKQLILKNIPLLLQVDLGYFDYIQEEEINQEDLIHFGGHFITLAGFDESQGLAYVGDSSYEGFQEVPIETLKNARNSSYGPSFLHPNNTQYLMNPRPDGKHPPLAAGIKLAIKKVVDNMLRPSISNNGLQGLKNFSENILEWREKLNKTITNTESGKEKSLAEITFQLIHAYIEEWGTGGALFRTLYASFLEEILKTPEIKQGPKAWIADELDIIRECVPLIHDSANKWTKFATLLNKTVDIYKQDCLENVDLMSLSQQIKEISLIEEKLFRNLLKIKL